MKANRATPVPAFVPVILTLESQAEVDAIYSVLNHVILSQILGIGDSDEAILFAHRDHSNCEAIHRSIRNWSGQ